MQCSTVPGRGKGVTTLHKLVCVCGAKGCGFFWAALGWNTNRVSILAILVWKSENGHRFYKLGLKMNMDFRGQVWKAYRKKCIFRSEIESGFGQNRVAHPQQKFRGASIFLGVLHMCKNPFWHIIHGRSYFKMGLCCCYFIVDTIPGVKSRTLITSESCNNATKSATVFLNSIEENKALVLILIRSGEWLKNVLCFFFTCK